jgi:hypothetical protein
MTSEEKEGRSKASTSVRRRRRGDVRWGRRVRARVGRNDVLAIGDDIGIGPLADTPPATAAPGAVLRIHTRPDGNLKRSYCNTRGNETLQRPSVVSAVSEAQDASPTSKDVEIRVMIDGRVAEVSDGSSTGVTGSTRAHARGWRA